MRYIALNTKSIKLGNQDFATRELIAWCINSDRRFNGAGQGIRSSTRIDASLRKNEKEHFVALQEDDWKLLCEALEEPSDGFPFRPARNLLPFIDEVKAAGEVEPPAPKLESIEVNPEGAVNTPKASTGEQPS